MTERPLHEMNPTSRFTDRVSDYVKFRPAYPIAAVDGVLAGLPSPCDAADVGAGTGIFARMLGDRGVRAIAIEPNAAMREAARVHPSVEMRSGRAESTGLAEASVDLVTCAQAFHWFDADVALAEFHRILHRRGRLALVWNDRDPADPVATAYRDAIRSVGGVHPSEARSFDPAILVAGGRFAKPLLREYAYEQALDESGFVGRAMSASYAPNQGEPAEELKCLLRRAHQSLRGGDHLVRMKYITRVWTAESVP